MGAVWLCSIEGLGTGGGRGVSEHVGAGVVGVGRIKCVGVEVAGGGCTG